MTGGDPTDIFPEFLHAYPCCALLRHCLFVSLCNIWMSNDLICSLDYKASSIRQVGWWSTYCQRINCCIRADASAVVILTQPLLHLHIGDYSIYVL